MNTFFSDREHKKIPLTEHINNDVWSGIGAVIEKFKRDDSLSLDFPLSCPDGGTVCGFDEELFKIKLKALIPSMDYPFPSIDFENPWENETYASNRMETEQYAVLDTIEFVYAHLHDAVHSPKRYHEYFHHYELEFNDNGKSKAMFRDSINEIFRRNGVLFELNSDGQIVRILPPGQDAAIQAIPVIKEQTVNDLVSAAVEKHLNPRFNEQKIGLEKLWDAFERIKTTYSPLDGKKISVDKLLDEIAAGDVGFKQSLDDECNNLTKLGNNYQIRHFEVDKKPIASKFLSDYLFGRMLSMVNLMLSVMQ